MGLDAGKDVKSGQLRSSYFLALLLIINPFMLVFFQNCSFSSGIQIRSLATQEEVSKYIHSPTEEHYRVSKDLIIK